MISKTHLNYNTHMYTLRKVLICYPNYGKKHSPIGSSNHGSMYKVSGIFWVDNGRGIGKPRNITKTMWGLDSIHCFMLANTVVPKHLIMVVLNVWTIFYKECKRIDYRH